MGIFDFFIIFHQIVNSVFGNPVVNYLYNGNAIFDLVAAGVLLNVSTVLVFFVKDKDDIVLQK